MSLREFEQRLFSLQQQINDQLRAQRELVDARAAALAEALTIQAKEYERRLHELNNAHERAAQNWQRSLQREVFDAILMEWGKWRDNVNAQVVTLVQTSTRVNQLDTAVHSAEGQLILLNQQVAQKLALGDRVKKVEDTQNSTQHIGPTVVALEDRIKKLEAAQAQAIGALGLIRFMGFAGLLGLIITFLRMIKFLP